MFRSLLVLAVVAAICNGCVTTRSQKIDERSVMRHYSDALSSIHDAEGFQSVESFDYGLEGLVDLATRTADASLAQDVVFKLKELQKETIPYVIFSAIDGINHIAVARHDAKLTQIAVEALADGLEWNFFSGCHAHAIKLISQAVTSAAMPVSPILSGKLAKYQVK